MSEQALDALWARIRLEFLALAGGGTMNLDGNRVSESKNPSKAPPRAGEDVDYFEREWRKASRPSQKRAVLLCQDCEARKNRVGGAVRCCATGALRSYLLPSADPKHRRGTKEWREAMAQEDQTAAAVALMYGVRKETVLQARKEFLANPPRRGRRPLRTVPDSAIVPNAAGKASIFPDAA